MAHQALLDSLRQAKPLQQLEAARRLAELADASDQHRLLSLLRGGQNSGVRSAAAWVLGLIPPASPRTLPVLLQALLDTQESPAVRAQVAQSLGELHRAHPFKGALRSRAGSALNVALQHPDPELRFWAAHSLGKLRYAPAAKALRELSQTDPRFGPDRRTVADQARQALRLLEGRRIGRR